MDDLEDLLGSNYSDNSNCYSNSLNNLDSYLSYSNNKNSAQNQDTVKEFLSTFADKLNSGIKIFSEIGEDSTNIMEDVNNRITSNVPIDEDFKNKVKSVVNKYTGIFNDIFNCKNSDIKSEFKIMDNNIVLILQRFLNGTIYMDEFTYYLNDSKNNYREEYLEFFLESIKSHCKHNKINYEEFLENVKNTCEKYINLNNQNNLCKKLNELDTNFKVSKKFHINKSKLPILYFNDFIVYYGDTIEFLITS